MGQIADRPYWMVIFSVFVRAIHQIGAGVFLAAYLLDAVSILPGMYLATAGVSGGVLILTEMLRHRQLFRELTGISTVLKLVVLGLAYHGLIPPVPSLVFVFVLASLCSHAPKFVRHRLLF
jgi:hypothetical protein